MKLMSELEQNFRIFKKIFELPLSIPTKNFWIGPLSEILKTNLNNLYGVDENDEIRIIGVRLFLIMNNNFWFKIENNHRLMMISKSL